MHVMPHWRSPEIGVHVLMPSRQFVEAKTRAWRDLLKSEVPAARERDAAYFEESAASKKVKLVRHPCASAITDADQECPVCSYATTRVGALYGRLTN
jgi:hypothetical protein